MERVDVVVLGAGGAGLFCAAQAGARGKSVIVIDHNEKPGRKILISGGGRCNFTNLGAGPETYQSRNPHFCRSALARYTPADFIALVDRHGIRWHEKKLGQLFCDDSAKSILAMLVAECDAHGVRLRLGTQITAVERAPDGFVVQTSRGAIATNKLVLATGGLSIPPIGATDFGYRLAKQFGLAIVPTTAALVPFVFAPADRADLAGVATDADVTCGGQSFREAILFTHTGLSGPAILQISTWWDPGQDVTINLLPDIDLMAQLREAKRSGMKQSLPNFLATLLPKRLVQHWVQQHRIPDDLHRIPDVELRRIVDAFQQWTFIPAGTEGYRTAEVTRGGIDTDELSSKTMEAKRVPGLHCIGEVVDVTGWLGGYNFQWAWASAHAAAMAL